jgi:hypothetical protein
MLHSSPHVQEFLQALSVNCYFDYIPSDILARDCSQQWNLIAIVPSTPGRDCDGPQYEGEKIQRR